MSTATSAKSPGKLSELIHGAAEAGRRHGFKYAGLTAIGGTLCAIAALTVVAPVAAGWGAIMFAASTMTAVSGVAMGALYGAAKIVSREIGKPPVARPEVRRLGGRAATVLAWGTYAAINLATANYLNNNMAKPAPAFNQLQPKKSHVPQGGIPHYKNSALTHT